MTTLYDIHTAIAEAVAAQRGAYEPSDEERAEVADWLAELDTVSAALERCPRCGEYIDRRGRCGCTQAVAPVAYTLPAPALVRDALARLAATAQAAGDTANANALNRADYQISRGIYPAVAVSADGTLLVPSKESAGTVYRVTPTGCSCTAGQHGRPCWHASLAEALAVAREDAAALLDDTAALAA